jgi:hypothetical protein
LGFLHPRNHVLEFSNTIIKVAHHSISLILLHGQCKFVIFILAKYQLGVLIANAG